MIASAPLPPPAVVCVQATAELAPAAALAGPRDVPNGFAGHLVDAIGVNVGRARTYARQSQGRSWPLSVRLIATEALLIPTAWVFDLWGGSFRPRGVAPVTGDFAPMAAIPPADRPLTPFRPPAPRVWADLADEASFYGDVIRSATAAQDFRLVCQACEALVDLVDRMQATHGLPLPMTRHVVESVGYGAAHAVAFGRVSQGATDGLYAQFLGLQAMGIQAGIDLDRDSSALHAEGVGFLVNDLPQIPFLETWRAVR